MVREEPQSDNPQTGSNNNNIVFVLESEDFQSRRSWKIPTFVCTGTEECGESLVEHASAQAMQDTGIDLQNIASLELVEVFETKLEDDEEVVELILDVVVLIRLDGLLDSGRRNSHVMVYRTQSIEQTHEDRFDPHVLNQRIMAALAKLI